MTGAGSTITCNGKQWGYLGYNNIAGTQTLVDALSCSGFWIVSGICNWSNFDSACGTIDCAGTLNITGRTCTIGGDLTLDGASTLTINAVSAFVFNGINATLTSGGKTLPACTFNADTFIDENCTFGRITYGTDGITLQFTAGDAFTISALAAANWNGALGFLNGMESSIAGTPFTLTLPNAVTVGFMDVRDCTCAGFAVTASDGTSVTRGGNTNWDFGFVLTGSAYVAGALTTVTDAAGVNQYPVSAVDYRLNGTIPWLPGVITAWGDDGATATVPVLPAGTYDVRETSSDGAVAILLGGFIVAAAGMAYESKLSIGMSVGL
jgi:hypothetical protein